VEKAKKTSIPALLFLQRIEDRHSFSSFKKSLKRGKMNTLPEGISYLEKGFMSHIGEIEVGTVVVERGKVFRVFKVREEDYRGESQKIIYYRPYYDEPSQNGLICSIPIESIEEANIRIPSSKKEIKAVLNDLRRQVRLRDVLQAKDAKLAVNANDITETIAVIKKFWAERKKRESGSLPKSKKDILESAIDQVVQEIAYVSNTSLKKAHEKVSIALGN
jgi:RNA polymerase-interacting CarD/CdnL/TRCF family regulator